MSPAIVGIGTWLPDGVRTNAAWPSSFFERARQNGERIFNDIPAPLDERAAAIVARDLAAEALDPMLGATRRHVADNSFTSAEAEARAGRAALADAGLDPLDVDILLSYAAVPDRITPPTGPAVAHLVGAKRATAIAIEAACASSISQIEVAFAYVQAGLAKHVLITQSHLMLRAFPLLHPASPGLGDAASALVVSRGPGLSILATFGQTHGEHALSVTWVRGNEDASDTPWWCAGGDLRVGSRRPEGAKFLMRETVSFGADAIREAARRAEIDVKQLDVVASVQPRGFMPPAIAECLGLARDRAVSTYDEIAHVGACGPIFNLSAARKQGRLVPGALVAMYGQGAGFTRAAAIQRVQKSAST
jgi:3-oxoacyl-[acyl-carrier-protein] synthase-3